MKKVTFIIIFLLTSLFTVQGQTWETIGAGVAEFLLSNPKTADNMKPDQQAALSIIGNLLMISADRKHDINVAEAGKTQINLNTNSGQQLQLVKDKAGNVYIVSNGLIYPISENIVNQAKKYILNQQPGYMNYVKGSDSDFNSQQLMLPNFNLNNLSQEWDKPLTYTNYLIHLNQTTTIKDFLEEKKLSVNDIYVASKKDINHGRLYKFGLAQKFVDKNKYKITSKDGFAVSANKYYLFKRGIALWYRGMFTAKWVRDLNDNNAYELNEFQDIRRNFYQNESFLIVLGLYCEDPYFVKLTILNQLSGETVYNQELYDPINSYNCTTFSFKCNFFKPGIYVYTIAFIRPDKDEIFMTKSDKFQILSLKPINHNRVENNATTIPSTNSSSKTKMMNDLIQLLKEGKISEETFKTSMKALENN